MPPMCASGVPNRITVLTDAPLPDYVDGIRLQAFQAHDGRLTLIFDREPEVRVGAGELLEELRGAEASLIH